MTTDRSYSPSPALAAAIYGGMILILVATLLPILGKGVATARWIFAAGALANLVGRLMAQRGLHGLPLRIRRLYRLEMWSGVFFAVASFFMFYTPATPDWLAFTLAGGAVLVYTSLMIPREMRKKKVKNLYNELLAGPILPLAWPHIAKYLLILPPQ